MAPAEAQKVKLYIIIIILLLLLLLRLVLLLHITQYKSLFYLIFEFTCFNILWENAGKS